MKTLVDKLNSIGFVKCEGRTGVMVKFFAEIKFEIVLEDVDGSSSLTAVDTKWYTTLVDTVEEVADYIFMVVLDSTKN